MSDNPRKVKYALGLLLSLEELHDENFVCDFTINVGDVSFQVHRTILAASSKYFKAMLESGMIEVKQGYINMKGISPTIMKICIKYIYNGDAELTLELVGSILEAAHLMQLNDLVEDCFNFLRENMSDKSCVSTITLCRLYSRQDIEDLAERYLLENFRMVSATQSFTSISKDDFVRYVNTAEADHEIMWQAVVAWVSSKADNRDQLLSELSQLTKIKDFPFNFLLGSVLGKDIVKNSTAARDYILEIMFSQNDAKSSLTVDNVFALKLLIRKSSITSKDKAMNIVKEFMLENFADLIEKDEFVHLDEDDILMFLQSPETKSSSEEFKWKSILKWTNHEHRRKILFTKFFKLIHLEQFEAEFIRDKIRVESMVKESAECMDLILQVVLDQKEEQASKSMRSTRISKIAVLCSDNGGTVKVFDEHSNQFRILSRFKGTNMVILPKNKRGMVNCDGYLYVLIKENLFKLVRDNKWIQLSTMPRELDAWPEMVSFQDDVFVLVESSTMACYHPARNEWNVDLPGCGIDPTFRVVASDKHLFTIGGRRYGYSTNEVKKFDPKNGSWSNMPPMLAKRSGASAAMLHGMIFVTGGRGGYNDDLKFLDSAECYNIFTCSWSQLPKMNSIRCGHSMIVVCDKLYVCGNNRKTDGKFEKGTIEVFDGENAKWQTLVTEKFLHNVPTCAYNE